MASSSLRTFINPSAPTTRDSADRRKSHAAPKREIWSSLLKSVSSGKRLPEKQLLLLGAITLRRNQLHDPPNIVLGGTPETQRDFLESLSTESAGARRHQSRKAPIANQYALGYTYQDVLDADHEGRSLSLQSKFKLTAYRHPSPPLRIHRRRPITCLLFSLETFTHT